MKETITEFLSYLKIPVAKEYTERLLSSHPDYPTLLSIADTFDRLGIDYVIGKMDKTKRDQLSYPYLLQVAYDMLIVIKDESDLLRYHRELLEWDGIVLHVEPTRHIPNVEHKEYYQKEKFNNVMRTLSLLTTAFLLVTPLAIRFSIQQSLSFMTSLAGVVVGFLLISKELGIKYKAVEAFCKGGANSSCDKVLTSNEATIAGNIKLSDAVFVYFIFQILSVSLASAVPQWTNTLQLSLSLLSVLAIPVVLFSLYVQYVKGIWCRLCLVVDAILAVQVVMLNISVSVSQIPTLLDRPLVLVVQALLFVLIGSVWLIIKNRSEALNELDKLNTANARVKNNIEVFTHLLNNQKKVKHSFLKNELRLGKKDAPVQIIMASNLYCRPCKDQHAKLTTLLQLFPDLIEVAVRFVPSKDASEKPNSNQYLLQYWWKKIRGNENETDLLLQLFHNWYEHRDLEQFRKAYPLDVTDQLAETEQLESNHYRWMHEESITATPTFILNGQELPKEYEIGDIANLIVALTNEWKSVRSSALENELEPINQ